MTGIGTPTAHAPIQAAQDLRIGGIITRVACENANSPNESVCPRGGRVAPRCAEDDFKRKKKKKNETKVEGKEHEGTHLDNSLPHSQRRMSK